MEIKEIDLVKLKMKMYLHLNIHTKLLRIKEL